MALAEQVLLGSGLTFSGFLSVHLINTFAATRGADLYDGILAGLRPLVRAPVVEFLIIGSAAVHVGTASWLVSARLDRFRSSQRSFWGRARRLPGVLWSSFRQEAQVKGLWRGRAAFELGLQRVSGFVLATLLPGHVFLVRGLPALAKGRNYEFAAIHATLREWPYLFYPYYVLLGSAGACHLLFGWRSAWDRAKGRQLPLSSRDNPRSSRVLLAVGISSALVTLATCRFGGLLGNDMHYTRQWRHAFEGYADAVRAPDWMTKWAFPWKKSSLF
jgi:succinate dehydrogenase/fumarate reductase cytochrome b subunit